TLAYSPTSFLSLIPPPPRPTLFPYTTLFRSPTWAIPCGCTGTGKLPAPPQSKFGVTRSVLQGSASCLPLTSTSSPSSLPRLRPRSEEHTSELQSRFDLVCRLLLEKKKKAHMRRLDYVLLNYSRLFKTLKLCALHCDPVLRYTRSPAITTRSAHSHHTATAICDLLS